MDREFRLRNHQGAYEITLNFPGQQFGRAGYVSKRTVSFGREWIFSQQREGIDAL